MARVTFLADYDYTPLGTRGVIIAYKAERGYTVRRECADLAVMLGKAVEIEPPPRPKGRFNYADEDAFDHDNRDGAGGSRKGRRRRKPA